MKTFDTYEDARDYSNNNPSETVECKSYKDNGNPWGHYFFVNGLYNGEYKSYFNNGQLYEHCFFKDGNYHGEYKWYHENGQLRVHCFFVNGNSNSDSNKHGESKSYNDNGSLYEHSFYVNNEELDLDHLKDGSYKSKCILSTLFDGNLHEDV